jgi:hypothetical protein
MPNTTLTADIIANEALAILDNELGVLDTFHRGYEGEFDKKVNGYSVGDTISIRRPHDPLVRTGAVRSDQDVIEGKVALTIDQQVGHDFKFTSQELTLKIDDLSERVIKPAIINLRNHIANDCLVQAYRGAYNWVGTPGQVINSFADFAKAPERMDEMSIPMENRYAALSPADFWGMLGSQSNLYIQNAANGAYRDGSLGKIGGVDTMMSQVVPTHTVGPLGGTPLVNGGAQSVSYDTVKNTWSQSFITDGWTAAVANRLKAGDVFTIANVFMVNAKTKANTGILQQFVVKADASSDVAGNLTATISPPIIITGPHQTVNAAPADNVAITMLGAANTGYKQNLFYHKNAFALAMVPMEMPAAAYGGARKSAKGLSVRVIPGYDNVNDVSNWRLDLLYGRKMIDERLIVRGSGTA